MEDWVYFENLPAALEHSAQTYEDKTALSIANGISYTYNEINALVNDFATKLYGAGLERNQRVAIISENNPHWVISYFGIQKSGGIVFPRIA